MSELLGRPNRAFPRLRCRKTRRAIAAGFLTAIPRRQFSQTLGVLLKRALQGQFFQVHLEYRSPLGQSRQVNGDVTIKPPGSEKGLRASKNG